jgi:hypothetical protein
VATERIWKAVQTLGGPVETAAEPEAELVAAEPVEAHAGTGAAQPETTAEEPTSAQPAQDVAAVEADPTPKATRTKRVRPAATEPKAPRQGSKIEIVLALLKREGGVSAQELMNATGWQAHSVRGFISGTLGKKMGLTVLSAKVGEVRTYSIQA